MTSASKMASFRITRFQFHRNRVIGDSQVRSSEVYVAAVELIALGVDVAADGPRLTCRQQ